ncbi:MAG: T9SS type A sorting domain-containing protein [bacterium]|nr:T9SS type A sorting domain-containing protein [bacterium]
MRKFLLCFFILTCVELLAQTPRISFQSNDGLTNISFSFSEIYYPRQYMFDTTPNFNSKYLRVKVPIDWTDTVQNLKLNRTYYFRSRYTSGPNTSWINSEYYTATYPILELLTNKSLVFFDKPMYYYDARYSVDAELWYDTIPTFNSSALKKFKSNTRGAKYLFDNTENFKTYYLRGRTFVKNDTLPWRTIKVTNKFKPTFTYGESGCKDTNSITFNICSYNYITNATSFTTTAFIYYNDNKIDSNKTFSYCNQYGITDTNKIKVISISDIVFPTYSKKYIDTTYFESPLKAFVPIDLRIDNGGNGKIGFNLMNVPCNTRVEVELYTDSTLTNKVQTYASNNSSTIFNIPWDPFSNNMIRYRFKKFKSASDWIYYSNKNFEISLSFYASYKDTTLSDWSPYKNYTNNKYKMEVWVDKTPDFNSVKLTKILVRDSSYLLVNSIFAKYNYAKCRMVNNRKFTLWSNTISKQFTNALIKPILQYNYPTSNISAYPLSPLDKSELQLGRTPTQFHKSISFDYTNFLDTLDFNENEIVYYRARRYTKIDTSDWGQVLSTQLKISNFYCVTPYITYDGNASNKDTFYLRWSEKSPSNSEGYYLYLGKSKKDFNAIVSVPKGVNEYLVNKKDFPSNWYYALYPVCGINRNNTLIEPIWKPLNANTTSLFNSEIVTYPFYFNAGVNLIQSISEQLSQCEIYDLQGRLIINQAIEANGTLVLSQLSSGRYYARFSNPYCNYNISFFIP